MNIQSLSNLLRKEKSEVNNFPKKGVVIGNRIPKDYFITRGTGESDITIHAGSYHLALKAAGIEKANIMTYSSILPSIANKINKPKNLVHGSVMETIMATSSGEKGEYLNAGIIYGWLYERTSGEKYGGLVCEHHGSYSDDKLREKLYASLHELYYNGFEEYYSLKNTESITQSLKPQKNYGTALVALCFTNYFVPLLE